MGITIHASFLPHDDPDLSLAFYRDILGFEVRDDVGYDGKRWIAVGCSSLGTFSTRFTELVGMPPSAYRREGTHPSDGMPPCVAKKVTRPVRNREARPAALPLA